MTENMIYRVAEAIARSTTLPERWGDPYSASSKHILILAQVRSAEAAIAAMLEPTQAMIDGAGGDGSDEMQTLAKQIYAGMITAALEADYDGGPTHVDNTSPTPATLEPGGEQG